MDRVMNRVVTNITGDEPGPDCRRGSSKKKEEQAIKNNRQRNAHRRRHDQPFCVVRIIVMNTVNDEMKLFADFTARLVVKRAAMNDVFEQRPRDYPESEPFD